MSKTKTPLLSLQAIGTIAKTLTMRRKGPLTIAEKTPIPKDAKTPDQLSWRTMYEQCATLWHTLSASERATWESLARSKHMTGFAFWQSQCLRPNPGIYLPLAGGTMQGDIIMGSHKITGLPEPTLDPDAATKAYVDAAGGGFDPFAQFLAFLNWESIDGLIASGDTGYSVLPQYPEVMLLTGNVANRDARIRSSSYFVLLSQPGQTITIEFPIVTLSTVTNCTIWLRLSETIGDPPNDIEAHVGWKLSEGDLYASNGNGSASTLTDTAINLVSGEQRTRLLLEFTPGTNVKFYVNGTLKATHTTNLPTATGLNLLLHIRTLTNAMRYVKVERILIQKAYA